MSDNLEKLYEKYNVLSDAKENIAQHSKEYVASIECIKGNESEKMLAAQILSKFFKHFPELQDKALNAILDLCEDDEVKIRACAMRYLVSICKDVKEHVMKVTDILAQMMQLEQRDVATATWCILQLWKEDSAVVLKTMYNHIHSLTNNMNREKCLEFVHKRLIKSADSLSADLETIVVEECKKILQDDNGPGEVLDALQTLRETKYGKTITGQQELLDMVVDLIDVENNLDVDVDSVDRVILCVSHAVKLLSSKNESSKFVIYYCEKILPAWDKIVGLKEGELVQLQLLRQLAELSIFCGKLENPSLCVVQIFDKIKLYMPLPPQDVDVSQMPNFEFSFVECLLFAFHRLARQCPDFLTHDPDVLKDFRARLTYFSRGVQGCHKVINVNKAAVPQTNETITKLTKAVTAPVLLNNLNALIKDLFYQPPLYKCNVTLSWIRPKTAGDKSKPAVATAATTPEEAPANAGQKRHVPITFDNGSSNNPKQPRTGRPGENMKLYSPPSGKFSNNFQSYDRSSSRGNRSRGRGGSRGRGRNWRN